MNYYETLYIVHSALETGRLKDIILTVEKSLKENGGELIATEVWGKKKLGYYIDKQKYGTYILVQFKSDGTNNNNFNIQMEHNPGILAYMTVKIEEDGIREQTEDLDTQIAGKEVKASRTPRPVDEKISTEKGNANKVEEAPTKIEGTVEEAPIPDETPTETEVAVEEESVEVKESKEEPIADEIITETEVASEEKVEE